MRTHNHFAVPSLQIYKEWLLHLLVLYLISGVYSGPSQEEHLHHTGVVIGRCIHQCSVPILWGDGDKRTWRQVTNRSRFCTVTVCAGFLCVVKLTTHIFQCTSRWLKPREQLDWETLSKKQKIFWKGFMEWPVILHHSKKLRNKSKCHYPASCSSIPLQKCRI